MKYEELKKSIEKEICLEHKLHPKVEKIGSEIKISACCEKFRDKMQTILNNKMDDYFKSSGSSGTV